MSPVGICRARLRNLSTTLEQLLYYVDIYGPYVNLHCRFETSHTRELLEAHRERKAIVSQIGDADGNLLQGVADAMKTEFSGPIFLAGANNSRVDLLAAVPKSLTNKFQAGVLIQQIAPIVGGKGGGRPENARGMGKDASKIEEALARARELLEP